MHPWLRNVRIIPFYKVYVSIPPFILSTEEELTANIASFYGTEKTGKGNATVRLFAGQYGPDSQKRAPSEQKYTLVDTQTLFLVSLITLVYVPQARLMK
jgi:hypothetical protein